MGMQIENFVLFGKKMSFKQCSKCKEIKSVDDFFNLTKSSCGKMSQCKSCHQEGTRNWTNRIKGRVEGTLKAENVLKGIDVSRVSDDVGRVTTINKFRYLINKRDGKHRR